MKNFFKKRVKDFDEPSYAVIKLQIALIAMLVIVFFKPWIGITILAAIETIITIYYLFVLVKEIRKEFKKEFLQWFAFFFVILILIQLIWIIQVIPFEGIISQYLLFAIIFVLIFFSLSFKAVLGKKHTIGEVISSTQKNAIIKTKFDLMSFTKGGTYSIKTGKKFSPKTKVKVELKNHLFERKPHKITKKV